MANKNTASVHAIPQPGKAPFSDDPALLPQVRLKNKKIAEEHDRIFDQAMHTVRGLSAGARSDDDIASLRLASLSKTSQGQK